MLRHNKNINGVEMFQYEIISPISKHGDETSSEENPIADQSLPANSRNVTATFDIEADNTLKSSSGLFVRKSILHLWTIKNRPTIVIFFVLVGMVISLIIVVWILSLRLSKQLIDNHNGAEESPWEKYAVHSRNGCMLLLSSIQMYSLIVF